MRHLAIVALLFAAACGGKSSSSTVPEEEGEGEGEGKGPIEEEAAPGETSEVYGTLVSIEVKPDLETCFVTVIVSDTGSEGMFPAPDLCGKGHEDYPSTRSPSRSTPTATRSS